MNQTLTLLFQGEGGSPFPLAPQMKKWSEGLVHETTLQMLNYHWTSMKVKASYLDATDYS